MSEIEKAVQIISGYCDKVVRCRECRFWNEDSGCIFRQVVPPCYWEVRRKPEKKEVGP